MDKKINIYFSGATGIPDAIHQEVKSFRNEILEKTGFRLTLQQSYIELIKSGLKSRPTTIEFNGK